MERLVLFSPIEQLEERYSVQWFEWFMESFKRLNANVMLFGDTKPREIKQGQFLDIYDTNIYKAEQVGQMLKTIQNIPHDNFTVFCMDAWFSGIESLAYVRSCTGRSFKIKGMVHAGTWDKWDFLHQKNCQQWAKDYEKSLFKIYDEVFCATEFHKNMIEEYFGEKMSNITLVDFPVIEPVSVPKTHKENIVVFPHRLAKEKQPEMFEAMRDLYAKKHPREAQIVKWIRTKDVATNKEDYYKWLKQAKVSVSAALQETFGIAMLESYHYGCFPVVPDRLSYRETFSPMFRYESLEQAVDLIHIGLHCNLDFRYKYNSKLEWAHKIFNEGDRNVSKR